MTDVFSLVMAVVSVFSAVFILILVASFAWICVRALTVEDTSIADYFDDNEKLMREPLVEHIYAQDSKLSDIELSTCV